MSLIIEKGFGASPKVVTKGYASGGAPVAPNSALVTKGWGANQMIISHAYQTSAVAPVVAPTRIVIAGGGRAVTVSGGGRSVKVSGTGGR